VRRRRVRQPREEALPEHLPRVEVEADVPDDVKHCRRHGARKLIGYDSVETLAFERSKLWVRVTKYPKYVCPGDATCGVASPETDTDHRLRAIGHLHETEDEPQARSDLHVAIRAARRAYQTDTDGDGLPDEGEACLKGACAVVDPCLFGRCIAGVYTTTPTRYGDGQEAEAMELFKQVLAAAPIWVEVAPRVVPLGLLPDDPVVLKRISDLAEH